MIATLRREVERNAIRARNGIKYVSGADWAPPAPTPRDVVWRQGKVTLSRYRSNAVRHSPPLLLMIGLVSRSYIFDLHEGASFARQLRDAGFDVYVLDWGVPDAADAGVTIETYTTRYLPRAARAVLKASGESDLTLVGYCMGGDLALVAAAGAGLPLRNLVTMATPIDFEALPPYVEPLREADPSDYVDWTGCVPPSLIESLFRVRKPTAGIVEYVNLWENLWNDAYVGPHQAIARWTRDHVPMPGAAFRQVVESWLRDNAFLTNRLTLAGRKIDLRSIRVPVLGVITLRDEIVPPAAARPIGDVVGSEDFELMEIDSGHIGLTVSRKAARVTIPQIVDWLERHSTPRTA
jgi:polyhydroxyalkanoate synthase